MIGSLIRSVAAIIMSLVVALVLTIAMEGVSDIFHPFPAGVDTADYDVCRAHVARYPHWLLAVVVVGWSGTVFVSVWLATRFGAGRHPAHGIAIGILLVFAAAFNLYMLPYPVWFEVLNLLILPLAIVQGVRIGQGSQSHHRGADSEPDSSPDNGNL